MKEGEEGLRDRRRLDIEKKRWKRKRIDLMKKGILGIEKERKKGKEMIEINEKIKKMKKGEDVKGNLKKRNIGRKRRG